MAKKDLTIIVRAKNLTARAFKSITAGAKRMGKSIKNAASGAMKAFKNLALVGVAAGVALFAVGKKIVGLYQTQAAAEAKLGATLKSTGFAAGFTVSQLKKQAAELQKTTGVGDEVILSMQGILATFKNIKGDQFTETTAAVLDMGAAMGKAGKGSADVESAVIQIGKALNDPIANLGALGRVGIQFNDQQTEQIKTMAKAGDMAGAQAIILAELKTEFGGTAEAVNKSQHGLKNLKNALGDAGEEIGRAIVETEGFDGAILAVTNAVRSLSESGYIELWAENVAQAMREIKPGLKETVELLSALKRGVQTGSGTLGSAAAIQAEKEKKKSLLRRLFEKTPLGSLFKVGEIAASFGEGSVDAEQAALKEDQSSADRLAAIKKHKAAIQEQQEQMEGFEQARATYQSAQEAAAQREVAAAKALNEQLEQAAAFDAARVSYQREQARITKEIAGLEKQRAGLQLDQVAAQNDAQMGLTQKRIEAITGKLAEANKTHEERRAEKDSARSEKRLNRVAEKARAKEMHGGRLTKFEKDTLHKQDLKFKLDNQRDQLAVIQANKDQAEKDRAEKLRVERNKSLNQINTKLDAALRAV